MKHLFGDQIKLQRQAKQVFSIGKITFFELLREKILWSAFVFSLFSVSLAYAVSRLSFAENARIAMNFGLTAISLVGGMIAIVMGSTLIAKEIQNRTVYMILSKSISRWQFVLGRYLGLSSVLLLNLVVMASVVVGVFFLCGGEWNSLILKSLFLQAIEISLLVAIATIFSSFSSAVLAGVFTSGVWVLGHAMGELQYLTPKAEPAWIRPFLEIVSMILPDLSKFDIKAHVAHQIAISGKTIFLVALYGALYIFFSLTASCIVFSKKEI